MEAVDTYRPRPLSPTHKRLRISSETAYELSDRTAAALSLGEGDTVVKTVGGPQFRLTSRDREVETLHSSKTTKIEEN